MMAEVVAADEGVWSCCLRCFARIVCSIRDPELYRDRSMLLSELQRRNWNNVKIEALFKEVLSALDGSEVCRLCLGALQERFLASFVEHICISVLQEQQFEVDSFFPCFQESLSTMIRTTTAAATLGIYHETAVSMKEVLRWLYSPLLKSALNAELRHDDAFHEGACFIDIIFEHIQADKSDGRTLLPDLKHASESNPSKRRRTSKNLLSGAKIKKALSLPSVEIRSKWKELCPPPPVECKLEVRAQASRRSYFVFGRYTKYSRDLSHTPWDLYEENKRRTETSVEELIANPLVRDVLGHQGKYKFQSAGREDVDVRMLGRGRDFLLEIIDSPRILSGEMCMVKAQEVVNRSTELVQVQGVRWATRKDEKAMHQAASTKIKSYRAVVWVSRPVSEAELTAKLSSQAPFTTFQKTPIRVLHRRAQLTRPKRIHALRFSRLNSHFFQLDLITEAGTYIKEFVHGDRGRTHPSIGSFLDCDASILQLDVTNLFMPSEASQLEQTPVFDDDHGAAA